MNCNYLSDGAPLFYSYSLNNATDFLMNTEGNSDIESFSDKDDHDLAMLPPTEKANAETVIIKSIIDAFKAGLVCM